MYFTSTEYKTYGPNLLKTDADKIAVVKNVAKADSFSTVVSKAIAVADFAAADVTFAAVGNDLRLTFAAKANIQTSGTSIQADDLSIVVYSTATQKVHFCVDAQDMVVNATEVSIPSFTYLVKEPVAA